MVSNPFGNHASSKSGTRVPQWAAEELRLAGMHLLPEHSLRMVCPFCRAEHEQSLRLTRKAQALVFICYRAKCGVRGAVQSNGGVQLHHDEPRKHRGKPFNVETVAYPRDVAEVIHERYGISEDVLHYSGMQWSPSTHEMCFPVFDLAGQRNGVSTKVLGDKLVTGRKATLYYDETPPEYYAPPLYLRSGSKVVWLVEDVLSCLRITTMGANALALLGTNVGPRLFSAIPSYFQKVVIALDPDALDKAHKIQRELDVLPVEVVVVDFYDDPKDVTLDYLSDALGFNCSLDKGVYIS